MVDVSRVIRNGWRFFLSSPLLKDSAVSMATRSFGLVLAFVSHLLLSRTMGAHQYGLYVIALGWALILVLPARLGLDHATLRYATVYREYGRLGELRGFIRFSLISMALASFCVGLLILATKFFPVPAFRDTSWLMIASIAGMIFPLAAIGWASALLRTAQRIMSSQFFEHLLRPLMLLIGIGFLWSLGIRIDSISAMQLTLISAIVVLIAMLISVKKVFGRIAEKPNYAERSEWVSLSWVILIMGAFQEMTNQADILLLGMLADASSAGLFSAATRLSSLVPFGLTAIVMISGPMIASAYHRRDWDELAGIARLTSRASLAFALAVALFLATFGRPILRAFGPEFDAAYPILLVLLVGGLVNAATGSVAYLMIMTGRQKAALVIIALALLLSVSINVILIPILGPLGSAIASSAAVATLNLNMLVYVRRTLGIDGSMVGLPVKRKIG